MRFLVNCDVGDWVFVSVGINSLYFFALFFLCSAQAERVGMVLITALFYSFFCVARNNYINNNPIARLETLIVLAMPVFLFPSARAFL